MPNPIQSSASAPRPTVSRGIVVATVAGNALEFYDFVTYAYFAVFIGQAFFPADTAEGRLLASVAVFWVGFLFRPLGGLLIGAYADRAGRRPAMLLTIALITIGTLGLALTPSYQSIGIAAPIIVVLCRLVQGLALGGDVGPATAYLVEIAPPGERGLYASWQLASQGIAAAAGGLFGMAMSYFLSKDELAAWGWRVPFCLGFLLLPVALYLRSRMPETLTMRSVVEAAEDAQVSLKNHAGLILISILLIAGGTIPTYVGTYMSTYAITTLKLPATNAMAATVINGTLILLCALLGGWLSDRFGRRSVMLIPRIVYAVVAIPGFMLLGETRSTGVLLGLTALLGAMTAISAAAAIVAIPELLPRPVRALGLSIAYALGVSIFGGSTQYVITWLLQQTHNPAAPAWYSVGACVISSIAIAFLPRKPDALESAPAKPVPA